MRRKKHFNMSNHFWVIELWKVASSGTAKSQIWGREFSSSFVLYALFYEWDTKKMVQSFAVIARLWSATALPVAHLLEAEVPMVWQCPNGAPYLTRSSVKRTWGMWTPSSNHSYTQPSARARPALPCQQPQRTTLPGLCFVFPSQTFSW